MNNCFDTMENPDDDDAGGIETQSDVLTIKEIVEVCNSTIIKEAEVQYVYAPGDAAKYFTDSVPFLFCLSLMQSQEPKVGDSMLYQSSKGLTDSQELFSAYLGEFNDRSQEQESQFVQTLLHGVSSVSESVTDQCCKGNNSEPNNCVQGIVSLLLDSVDGTWNPIVTFCARVISYAILSRDDAPAVSVVKWIMDSPVYQTPKNQFTMAINQFLTDLSHHRRPKDLTHDSLRYAANLSSVAENPNAGIVDLETKIRIFAALDFLLMKSELNKTPQTDNSLERIVKDNKTFIWSEKAAALRLFRYFQRKDLIRTLVLNAASSAEALMHFLLTDPDSEVCADALRNIAQEEGSQFLTIAPPSKDAFRPFCSSEPTEMQRQRADDLCSAILYNIIKERNLGVELACNIPFLSLHLMVNTRCRSLICSEQTSWMGEESSLELVNTAKTCLLKLCYKALSEIFCLRLFFELGVLEVKELFWQSTIDAKLTSSADSNVEAVILWCFDAVVGIILDIFNVERTLSTSITSAQQTTERTVLPETQGLTCAEGIQQLMTSVAATDLEVDHLVETYITLVADVGNNATVIWRLLRCLVSSKSMRKSTPPMTRFIDPSLLGQSPKGSESLALLFHEYLVEGQAEHDDDNSTGSGWLRFSLLRPIRKSLFEFLLKRDIYQSRKTHSSDRKFGSPSSLQIKFKIDQKRVRKMHEILRQKGGTYGCAVATGLLLCMMDRREEAIIHFLKYCTEYRDPSLAYFLCPYVLGKRNCSAGLVCCKKEIWAMVLAEALKTATEEAEVDRVLAETLCHSLLRPIDVFSLLCEPAGRICRRIRNKMTKLGQTSLSISKAQQLIEELSAEPGSVPPSLTVAACTVAVEEVYADESTSIEKFSKVERALLNACSVIQTECIQTGKLYYDKCLANLKDESKTNSTAVNNQALTLSIPHETCDICDLKLLSNYQTEAAQVTKLKTASSQTSADVILEAEDWAFRNKVYALQCGHLFHAKCCRTVTLPQMDADTLEAYKNLLKQVYWFSQSENDGSPDSTDAPKHCWTASHINEVYRSIEILLMAKCPLCSPNIIRCVTSPLVIVD